MRYAPRNNGQFVQIYSEAFRRKVIEEYLTSNVSKLFLLRKYGIKMKSGIQRWMKLYGYEDNKQPVIIKFNAVRSHALIRRMNTGKANKKQLEEKIKELERQFAGCSRLIFFTSLTTSCSLLLLRLPFQVSLYKACLVRPSNQQNRSRLTEG